MREAAGHLRIMAGGGLNLENTARIARETAVLDFHYGTAVRKGKAVAGDIDPERLAELILLLSSL